MEPLISVIIPTYNYATYIKEAINSIAEQDYPKDKIEIIVVDDGSTDNTKEVLEELIQNKTIQYYYQENQGKASATYKAIQMATGKYIFNLDADDYFLAGKINNTVTIFESDDSLVHVGTPAKQLLPNGQINIENIPTNMIDKPLEGNLLLKRFMLNNMLFGGGSTYAARANALKKIIIPAGVDMLTDEFLILALLPFGKSYFLNETLSVWRGHGNNYSLNAKSNDIQIIKGKRLLSSSDALLEYLKVNKFDKEIIDIYTLKNLTNHISFKEFTRTKSSTDILNYATTVFLKIKPGYNLIKQYHVLNRLLPTSLFNSMKNLFKKRANKVFVLS